MYRYKSVGNCTDVRLDNGNLSYGLVESDLPIVNNWTVFSLHEDENDNRFVSDYVFDCAEWCMLHRSNGGYYRWGSYIMIEREEDAIEFALKKL